MAVKTIYIGDTNGTSRKVIEIYGITKNYNDLIKKVIKKGYCTDNANATKVGYERIPRLKLFNIWDGTGTSSLDMVGAVAGNYFIYSGYDGTTAVDNSLTVTSISTDDHYGGSGKALSFNNHFCYVKNSSESYYDNNYYLELTTYNSSLTKQIRTRLSYMATNNSWAVASIGDYMLCAGGAGSFNDGVTDVVATVNAYNNAFTRTIPSALTHKRQFLGSGTVGADKGTYAIFICGTDGDDSTLNVHSPPPPECNILEAYNPSLTRTLASTNTTVDSSIRVAMTGIRIGTKVNFSGGKVNAMEKFRNNGSRSMEYFTVVDASLTQKSSTTHSGGGVWYMGYPAASKNINAGHTCISSGEYTAYSGVGNCTLDIKVIDDNFTLLKMLEFNIPNIRIAGALPGMPNYAIFTGGVGGRLDSYGGYYTPGGRDELTIYGVK